MAPVLKVHPETGDSLDKAKTSEEAKAEEVQRVKDLAELKERIKNKIPRKKKEKELLLVSVCANICTRCMFYVVQRKKKCLIVSVA